MSTIKLTTEGRIDPRSVPGPVELIPVERVLHSIYTVEGRLIGMPRQTVDSIKTIKLLGRTYESIKLEQYSYLKQIDDQGRLVPGEWRCIAHGLFVTKHEGMPIFQPYTYDWVGNASPNKDFPWGMHDVFFVYESRVWGEVPYIQGHVSIDGRLERWLVPYTSRNRHIRTFYARAHFERENAIKLNAEVGR